MIRILGECERACVVGTFETSKHLAYVVPDDKRLPEDMYSPRA